MADFNIALDWTLNFEDAARTYKTAIDNNGAGVIAGINAASYPQQFAAINALPQAERGPAVANFYQSKFWNQWYAQLVSNDLAKRVFDMGVNGGPETTVKILQESVLLSDDGPGASIVIDGTWGPHTVALANADDQEELIAEFKQQRLAHYQAIVANNPADAKYLGTAENPGPWWIRAVA